MGRPDRCPEGLNRGSAGGPLSAKPLAAGLNMLNIRMFALLAGVRTQSPDGEDLS